MTDRNRRRDLTVRMRHKDAGLVVYARQANRRDRYAARTSLSQERREAEDALRLERALDRVLRELSAEAERLDVHATTVLRDDTWTRPWASL